MKNFAFVLWVLVKLVNGLGGLPFKPKNVNKQKIL